MKKTKQTSEIVGMLAIAATIVTATATFAATAVSWDAASTSSGAGMVLTESGSSVTVSFPERPQANTLPTICDLLVGGSDPSSLFNGDLSAYTAIRFKINGDGSIPASVKLVATHVVGDGTSRSWVYDSVSVSTNAGEWMIHIIPLDMTKGWSTGYNFSDLRNKDPQYWWNRDWQDIDMLVVRIESAGMAAQSYSISQFQLLGEGAPTEPARLTPLQEYFGVNTKDDLTTAQKLQDTDGDGMSDLNEILAGMDPIDKASVFAAVTSKTASGNLVKWQGVLGGKYAVWRSNSLTGGFELLAGDLTATYTGVISYEDPDPVQGKPNFYKIVKY